MNFFDSAYKGIPTQAIQSTFNKGWKINYIRAAEFETMFGSEGVKAWLSSITRFWQK